MPKRKPPRRCRQARRRRRGSPPPPCSPSWTPPSERPRAAQPDAAAPRPRRRRGLVGARTRPQYPHMLFSLQQELHRHRRRPGRRRGPAVARRRRTVLLPRRSPRRAWPEPRRHARAAPAVHVHRARRGHDGRPAGREGRLGRNFLALPVEHEPGTHFVYNSGATYMVSAIVQKVTGQTVLDYLAAAPLRSAGHRGPTWENSPQGINIGGWGLSIKTEDIARFGLLYLQKGVWQGKRLLPEAWVAEATSKQVSNGDRPGQRLGAGLRLPVLALPARRVPGRRRLRPVLRRAAGAGRRRGDHGGVGDMQAV